MENDFDKKKRDRKNVREKMKSLNLFDSFRHAFDGIGSAFQAERNMKIHVATSLLVLVCGLWLKLSVTEWLICIAWIASVISAELINTAIEAVVDMTVQEYNAYAKIAKDVAAGAVLVVAIGAAVSGLLIFLPKLLTLVR